MLRKDFFQAEIDRLAQVVARIIGLRRQGSLNESSKLLEDTLSKDFELELSLLPNLQLKDFKALLENKSYAVQKLDLLAQLLVERAEVDEQSPEAVLLFNKVLLIFDLLEKEHHTQSLDNISKRMKIEKFLKAHKYE
jgi:hypothetical protein